MDVCTYARFRRPGHRATGDRSQAARHWMSPATRVGSDYAHAIVDDHSRLAYVELHADERAATVTAFLERALAFFAAHGITGRRLMTDNAFTYTKNRSLRELLADRGIRHLTTQPYRPRTNGKIERFHQTYGARMGARPQLPLKRAPSQPPERLARALQPPATALGHQRPTAHQPRSQPPGAGQLATGAQVGA
jgi:transposase InsO family protein